MVGNSKSNRRCCRRCPVRLRSFWSKREIEREPLDNWQSYRDGVAEIDER